MTGSAVTYWLLHGTIRPWSAEVLREGLKRSSQAAFVVPAGGLVDDVRLRRTLAVAMSHAVGLSGWSEAYAGRCSGEAVWSSPAVIALRQPDGWQPPGGMRVYEVRGEGSTTGGQTYRYLRVRDFGPIDAPSQPRIAIEAGWVDLAQLVAEFGDAVPTRWFNRIGAAPYSRLGASNRQVCEYVAARLIAEIAVLGGGKE